MIGRPLASDQASHEEISSVQGLAALSLDALTSVAYGPEAIVLVLASAGFAALPLIEPVTWAIVGLLAILVLSYSQVISAYPLGGGAYAVSRENHGKRASEVAAAALIVDYVLTVAVSIAAGVAALTSAFPPLLGYTVPLCIAMLAVITVLNLRGVGESARVFMLPTLLFIFGILGIIAVGLVHPLDLPAHVAAPPRLNLAAVAAVLLVLKAFSAGCSALTGVEAIANGVPLFKEPRIAHARTTELMLGVLLGVMLLGLAHLTVHFGIRPVADQTVLSQIMVASVGRSWFYYLTGISTTIVLGLAANTSFAGLPVLASLLARDNYVPHLFAIRGDRLVYQYGVGFLALLAGALLVAVGGNTNALIPLFAIGVFTGFTLSQSGLVLHWRKLRPARWRARAVLNGFGALATALATVIFFVSKFTSGAWVVAVAVPGFVVVFRRINAYYSLVAAKLAIGQVPEQPRSRPTLVIVPVNAISRLTALALSDALSLGSDVLAVSVVFDDDGQGPAREKSLEEQWAAWSPGVRLVVLRSRYHSVSRPLLRYIESLEVRSQERVMVLIPELQPRRWRHRVLQNQMGAVLGSALRKRSDVVVARVWSHLDEDEHPR
ncbi:MAG: APC family permease [Acidimicrobiales bacterium]